MKTRLFFGLLFAGILINLPALIFQTTPGYMDAEYYTAGAKQVFEGKGLQEPFLWNYLDDPVGIPHPSHTYWMPLSSIIAAAGMFIAGNSNFLSARIFFILLTLFIPFLTWRVAQKLTKDAWIASFSAWLSVFSGFYVVYLTNVENFAIFIILGGLFILLCLDDQMKPWIKYLLMGLMSGLFHLSRADGILWLIASGFLVFILEVNHSAKTEKAYSIVGKIFLGACVLFLGYVVVMGAWYIRNFHLYGSWMSPASSKAMWILNYDETFLYPSSLLTFERWMGVDWQIHLGDRLEASWTNLKTAIGVQGLVFQIPLIISGIWQTRKLPQTRFVIVFWCAVFGVMGGVFPFAGARGGFLHSSGAFQIYFWIMASCGLVAAIKSAARYRHWNYEQARIVLGSGLIILCAVLSIFLFAARVVGADIRQPVWQNGWRDYHMAEELLEKNQINIQEVIMVNNPPGFYLATGRKSVVIPEGGVQSIIGVADQFQVNYLILETNRVKGLEPLKESPDSIDQLKFIDQTQQISLYKILR